MQRAHLASLVRLALWGLVLVASPGGLWGEETAKKPDGKQVKIRSVTHAEIEKVIAGHRGKVVVMDAWSTYCPPCMKEFPHLVGIHKKHAAQGVACISLSFDFDGSEPIVEAEERALEFLKKQNASFDNLLAKDPDGLYAQYELASVPAVFVYDQQGKLVKRFDNEDPKSPPFTYQDVEQLVEKLLLDKGKKSQ